MAIVKSNNLIETSYRLGSREQFFILFLISQLDSTRDVEFQEYRIHYQEIAKLLNFDGKRRIANREDVFKIMDNLNNESIRFENEEVDMKIAWISSMRRIKSTDEFVFTFPKELKTYLLHLKEHFTQYNIRYIVNLSSHAMRMYEILKRYQFKGRVVLKIHEQLKFYLGIQDKYPEYYEFKRWVLLDAQKQLKKYTDIAFTFKPYKKIGRKIVSLEFQIFENTPKQIPKSLDRLNQITLGNVEKKTFDKKVKGEEFIEVGTKKNSPSHQQKLNLLTWSQLETYEFLNEKGVNKSFILTEILNHPKVSYEPLKGFEDVYIKIVWAFFKKKTTAKKLAGAFVTWWKKGRLTEDNLHAKNCELVIDHKKRMTEEKLNNRLMAKNMTKKEFIDFKKQQKSNGHHSSQGESLNDESRKFEFANIASKVKSQEFDLAFFQKEYPEAYEEIYKNTLTEFKEQMDRVEVAFDMNKYKKAIENNVLAKCKEWMKTAQ